MCNYRIRDRVLSLECCASYKDNYQLIVQYQLELAAHSWASLAVFLSTVKQISVTGFFLNIVYSLIYNHNLSC